MSRYRAAKLASGPIVAVALGLVVTGDGQAAAQVFKKLSGIQIRAAFTDRQLTDEVHFRDVYERDGAFRSYATGRKITGKWFIHLDELCLGIPDPDGGCFEVRSSGTKVVMTPKGTGLPIEGVLEPISDRGR